MGDWIHYIFFFGAVIVIAFLCIAAFRASIKVRKAKASRLAKDLDMELLASDNPNTLIVAGEINDRPSTVRYQKEKSSLEHIRNGLAKTPAIELEELLVSVQCNCAINFRIVKSDPAAAFDALHKTPDDAVPIALLSAKGLSLHSLQKEKAAFLFEEPETVQNLIDLFETSGATKIDLQANKVGALIHESEDTNRSPAQVSAILERLDKFARLLEFIGEEQSHTES